MKTERTERLRRRRAHREDEIELQHLPEAAPIPRVHCVDDLALIRRQREARDARRDDAGQRRRHEPPGRPHELGRLAHDVPVRNLDLGLRRARAPAAAAPAPASAPAAASASAAPAAPVLRAVLVERRRRRLVARVPALRADVEVAWMTAPQRRRRNANPADITPVRRRLRELERVRVQRGSQRRQHSGLRLHEVAEEPRLRIYE